MVPGWAGRDARSMSAAPSRPAPPARPDAASVLRGLVPSALTVLVLVAAVAGGRAGTGTPALLAAGAVLAAGLLLMAAVGLTVAGAARRRRARSAPPDIAAEWARVEPGWSGLP